MSKKLLRCFYFSLLFVFVACVPTPKIAPLPLYEQRDLSLEEVIAKVSDDIDVLKTIADINIEKNNEPYSSISASMLIKKPGWVHMRMYQLGILVRDFVIKDDSLYVLSGKNDDNLKKLGRELYNAIYWWDGYSRGEMSVGGETYIIRTGDREIHLDKTTLLPLKQGIKVLNKNIQVTYYEPVNNEGFWYPALLKIHMDDFTFTVKIKKLIKNPLPGESDFQVPSEN
ncbi:MAG: hypothetical protein HY757_09995 [Nitrospirae bacterium]|nr:hypothetical protein [Nitrospirota bacterium]